MPLSFSAVRDVVDIAAGGGNTDGPSVTSHVPPQGELVHTTPPPSTTRTSGSTTLSFSSLNVGSVGGVGNLAIDAADAADAVTNAVGAGNDPLESFTDAGPLAMMIQALGGGGSSLSHERDLMDAMAGIVDTDVNNNSARSTATTTLGTGTTTGTSTSVGTEPNAFASDGTAGQFPYVLESTGKWLTSDDKGNLYDDDDQHDDGDTTEYSYADGAYNDDSAGSSDEDALDAEKESFLLEQITAYETIEQLEEELAKEKRESETVSATLVDQVAATRAVSEVNRELRSKLGAATAASTAEKEEMRAVFEREVAAVHREVAAARQLHDAEVAMLRERMDALHTMVEELSWTRAHAENARLLTAEQLFTQALAAEADVVRKGLLTRLANVCTTGEDDGWCANTDWSAKLSRHIEQLRGGGGAAQITRLFAQAPIFIPRLLTSDVFKLFYDVLCLHRIGAQFFNPIDCTPEGGGGGGGIISLEEEREVQQQLETRMRAEVMTPGDVHRLIRQPSLFGGGANRGSGGSSSNVDGGEDDAAKLQAAFRFVRDAAEWGRIRLHLACTVQLCIRPEGEHGNSRQKVVDMFVSRPASLGLLNLITLQECANGDAADRDTLSAVAEAYVAITAELAVTEGVRGALLKADVVKALAKMLEHVTAIRPALQCIDRLSSDVVSTDFLIEQGLLGPIIFALGVWSRTATRSAAVGGEAAAEAADAEHVLTELFELLALISRSDAFAPAFDALCGYPVVTNALQAPLPLKANVAAADLLVNLHLAPNWTSESGERGDSDSGEREGSVAGQRGSSSAGSGGAAVDADTSASPFSSAAAFPAAEASEASMLSPDVFQHIFTFAFRAGDAVVARALDVLSRALVGSKTHGGLVTEGMLRDVLALVNLGSSALAYKAAYLIQGYAQSQLWNVHIFLKSGAAGVLGRFLQDYEGEVRGWMVGVVSRLASAAVAASAMLLAAPDGVDVADVLAGSAAPVAGALSEHHEEVTDVVFAAVQLTSTVVGPTATSQKMWGRAVEAAVLWTVHTHHVTGSGAAAALVEQRLPSSTDIASALGLLPSSSQVCSALRAVAQTPEMEPLLLKLGKHFVYLLDCYLQAQSSAISNSEMPPTTRHDGSASDFKKEALAVEDAAHIAACAAAVWDRQTTNAKQGFKSSRSGSGKAVVVALNVEDDATDATANDDGEAMEKGDAAPDDAGFSTFTTSASDDASVALHVLATAGYVQLLVQASALRTKPEGAGALLMRWAGSRLRGSETFCELAAATQGGIRGVVRLMNHNNSSFAAGAHFLSRLLRSETSATRSAVVEQAGLAVLLEVLRLSRDPLLQRAIASALPNAFDDSAACESVARAGGVVAHLVALVDTCPSNLELSTALRIIRKLASHERAAIVFLRHGGLRVLVEVALMQRYASADPDHASLLVDTEPCLLAILGYGKSANEVIGEEGGAPLLLRLLAESTSPTVVIRSLELLADIANGPSAASLLEHSGVSGRAKGRGMDSVTMWTSSADGVAHSESAGGGGAGAGAGAGVGVGVDAASAPTTDVASGEKEGGGESAYLNSMSTIDKITDVLNGGFDIGEPGSLDDVLDSIMYQEEGDSDGGNSSTLNYGGSGRKNLLSASQRATAARLAEVVTVQLAYNASAVPRGFTQHQTLQSIVEQGGLRAWIAVADPSRSEGRGEKALWAIATWLSLDSAKSNSLFVQMGGLSVLLAVTNHPDSTAEATRFARVALGKLLKTVGDQLTERISLLSAHVAEQGEQNVVSVWKKMAS